MAGTHPSPVASGALPQLTRHSLCRVLPMQPFAGAQPVSMPWHPVPPSPGSRRFVAGSSNRRNKLPPGGVEGWDPEFLPLTYLGNSGRLPRASTLRNAPRRSSAHATSRSFRDQGTGIGHIHTTRLHPDLGLLRWVLNARNMPKYGSAIAIAYARTARPLCAW